MPSVIGLPQQPVIDRVAEFRVGGDRIGLAEVKMSVAYESWYGVVDRWIGDRYEPTLDGQAEKMSLSLSTGTAEVLLRHDGTFVGLTPPPALAY